MYVIFFIIEKELWYENYTYLSCMNRTTPPVNNMEIATIFWSPTIVNIWRIILILIIMYEWKLHNIIHGCFDLITNLS